AGPPNRPLLIAKDDRANLRRLAQRREEGRIAAGLQGRFDRAALGLRRIPPDVDVDRGRRCPACRCAGRVDVRREGLRGTDVLVDVLLKRLTAGHADGQQHRKHEGLSTHSNLPGATTTPTPAVVLIPAPDSLLSMGCSNVSTPEVSRSSPSDGWIGAPPCHRSPA